MNSDVVTGNGINTGPSSAIFLCRKHLPTEYEMVIASFVRCRNKLRCKGGCNRDFDGFQTSMKGFCL